MDTQSETCFPGTTVDKLLSAITFYQQVKRQDPQQYEILMAASRTETFRSGDRVIEQGSRTSWLYFLISGQLEVTTDGLAHIVNLITPGEVFGGLATLLDIPRSATVIVDEHCREAVVFGTDFSIFGALKDITQVSFGTKLLYYQNLVHSLRWQLESNRIHFPAYPLAESHHKIKLFVGKRGTWEELASLESQGKALAQLVLEWNHVLPSLIAEEEAIQESMLHRNANRQGGFKQVYI